MKDFFIGRVYEVFDLPHPVNSNLKDILVLILRRTIALYYMKYYFQDWRIWMLDAVLRRVTIFSQRNLLMNRVVMHLSDLIAVTMGSSN